VAALLEGIVPRGVGRDLRDLGCPASKIERPIACRRALSAFRGVLGGGAYKPPCFGACPATVGLSRSNRRVGTRGAGRSIRGRPCPIGAAQGQRRTEYLGQDDRAPPLLDRLRDLLGSPSFFRDDDLFARPWFGGLENGLLDGGTRDGHLWLAADRLGGSCASAQHRPFGRPWHADRLRRRRALGSRLRRHRRRRSAGSRWRRRFAVLGSRGDGSDRPPPGLAGDGRLRAWGLAGRALGRLTFLFLAALGGQDAADRRDQHHDQQHDHLDDVADIACRQRLQRGAHHAWSQSAHSGYLPVLLRFSPIGRSRLRGAPAVIAAVSAASGCCLYHPSGPSCRRCFPSWRYRPGCCGCDSSP